MIRRSLTVSGLSAALTLGVMLLPPAFLAGGVNMPWATAPAGPPPPPISVIQGMSDLSTTRVHISDFITGETREYRGRWLLHGDVVLGVDLSKAAYRRIQPEKRIATLSLPDPRPLSASLDHDRSFEIEMRWRTWVPLSSPKSLRDEVWAQAAKKLEQLGRDPSYIKRSRAETEQALSRLFGGIGWTVNVEWPSSGSASQ